MWKGPDPSVGRRTSLRTRNPAEIRLGRWVPDSPAAHPQAAWHPEASPLCSQLHHGSLPWLPEPCSLPAWGSLSHVPEEAARTTPHRRPAPHSPHSPVGSSVLLGMERNKAESARAPWACVLCCWGPGVSNNRERGRECTQPVGSRVKAGSLGTLEVFPWASLSSPGLCFSREEYRTHLPSGVLSASEEGHRKKRAGARHLLTAGLMPGGFHIYWG